MAPDAGVETDTWTDVENGDFVTLYSQPIDAFTKRVLHKLIHYYHKVIGRKEKVRLLRIQSMRRRLM